MTRCDYARLPPLRWYRRWDEMPATAAAIWGAERKARVEMRWCLARCRDWAPHYVSAREALMLPPATEEARRVAAVIKMLMFVTPICWYVIIAATPRDERSDDAGCAHVDAIDDVTFKSVGSCQDGAQDYYWWLRESDAAGALMLRAIAMPPLLPADVAAMPRHAAAAPYCHSYALMPTLYASHYCRWCCRYAIIRLSPCHLYCRWLIISAMLIRHLLLITPLFEVMLAINIININIDAFNITQ